MSDYNLKSDKISLGLKSSIDCRVFIAPARRDQDTPFEYFARVCRAFDSWTKEAFTVSVDLVDLGEPHESGAQSGDSQA